MSRPPRFFISPDQISGSSVRITGEDVRHISTVLRMKPGELLLLCDGAGREFTVRIIDAGRMEIRTEILQQSAQSLPYPRVTLAQGLPKSDKMDLIIQKAVELGAASIVPLATERTIVKVKDEARRMERWRKIAREAAMQSNRPDMPRLSGISRYADFLASISQDDHLLLLPWEEGTEPVRNVLRRNPDAKDIIVLIGPEGGFSRQEAEAARAKGFHVVSLGPTILRTETAAIAALGMITYEYFQQGKHQ